MNPKSMIVISAAVSIFIVVPLTYMAADRQVPYEYLAGEITPYDVSDGQVVTVHWKIKVNKKCIGINQRQIVDSSGKVVNYDPTFALGINVTKEFSVPFEIPMSLAQGPAKYRVQSLYTCNLIQKIWPLYVTTPDVEFYVKRNN